MNILFQLELDEQTKSTAIVNLSSPGIYYIIRPQLLTLMVQGLNMPALFPGWLLLYEKWGLKVQNILTFTD